MREGDRNGEPSASRLQALAEQLEGLTGPDRATDCAIFCATAESPFTSYYPDCVLASLGGFAARVEIDEIPAYTASLDAAVALVERVMAPTLLDIEGSWEPRDKAVWPAWSVRWYPAGFGRDGKSWHAVVGTGPTPAIALLRALVSAKANESDTHEYSEGVAEAMQ